MALLGMVVVVVGAPHPSPMHTGVNIKSKSLMGKDGAGVFPASGNI